MFHRIVEGDAAMIAEKDGLSRMKQAASMAHYLSRSLKQLPGINGLSQTMWWRRLRHRLTLVLSRRRSCPFTCFFRMPTQFEALCGPVLDALMGDGRLRTLKVTVIGCSTGAEAYSIASVLRERHPDLPFTVYAYDIDRASVEYAKNARYAPQEVFNTDGSGKTTVTARFVDATFDKQDEWYVVKNDVKQHVRFDVADVLNPRLKDQLGTSDIVYAQHVLIHLEPRDAKSAFRNICCVLNPKAALFIAGMDLHVLQKQTRKHALVPLEYKMGEIYHEMSAYADGWPWTYDTLEPFMAVRKEWQRRYSTIFLTTELGVRGSVERAQSRADR